MEKALRTSAIPARGHTAAIFAALASAVILAPAPASAQGLFDFLFGRPAYYETRPVVAYAPDPGDFRDPPRRLKRAKSRSLDDLVYTGKPEKKPPPPVGKGPLGAFLNDPTLRAGDVVVTPKGLMVYRGNGGSVHANKEFVGLAKARTLDKSERRILASIEKANRLAPRFGAVPDVQTASGEPIRQASNDMTGGTR
jgi:hypothetical protein